MKYSDLGCGVYFGYRRGEEKLLYLGDWDGVNGREGFWEMLKLGRKLVGNW